MKNRFFRMTSSFVVVLVVLSSLAAFSGSAAAAGTGGNLGNPQYIEDFFVQGEILLKFKPNIPQSVVDMLYDKHGIGNLQTSSWGVIRAGIPKGKSVEQMVDIFSKNPNVEYAQPNYICQAVYTPDDEYFSYQWNLRNSVGGINAEDAWDLSVGTGAVVAILDTGIAYESYGIYSQAPDLAQTSIMPGYDFINNDTHANDDNAHGTHVAGTVAQSTNNGIGVAGVAYGATLMPVKVLGADGSGTSYTLADGLYFAADNGADVVNMSLAWPVYRIFGMWYAIDPGAVVSNAIDYADTHGVTLVAAAGNDSAGVVAYPAAYDQCIAVGATSPGESLTSFTNRGNALDLTAPGESILQETFDPNTQDVSDFAYWYFSGTSMASPHVAGVAALLVSLGVAEPAQIKQILYDTAEDHSTTGWDSQYGWGIVDAYAAVSSVAGSTNHPPVATSGSATTPEDTAVEITMTASDDDEGDSLTYNVETGPNNGTLSGVPPNVTYTPSTDYNGSDSFTFRAYDGKAYSNPATIDITITEVNDAPVAIDDSKTATENTVLTFPASDLTANDSAGPANETGQTFTVTEVGDASHGTVSLSEGSITYTPGTGYTGVDNFTYTIEDDGTTAGTSDPKTASGTVNITFTQVNNAPVANDDTYTINEDTTLNVGVPGVLENDTDIDGDTLTAELVNDVSKGTLMLNDDGSFSYTPNLNQNGTDSFTYYANDGITDSTSAAVVTINIVAINDAPVADAGGPYTGTIGEPIVFNGSGSSDPDDDTLTYDWNFGDGSTGIGEEPTHTYTVVGSYTVTLAVYDGNGGSAQSSTTAEISDAPAGLSISSIEPNFVEEGVWTQVIITGSGFQPGATVSLEGGAGPTPTVTITGIITATTIEATITTKKGGPPKDRYWDVRVTNPDSSTVVLEGGFIVRPK